MNQGPFNSFLSFQILKEQYQKNSISTNVLVKNLAIEALHFFEKNTILNTPISEAQTIIENKEKIEEILEFAFSGAPYQSDYFLVCDPLQKILLYQSESIKNLQKKIKVTGEEILSEIASTPLHSGHLLSYGLIMNQLQPDLLNLNLSTIISVQEGDSQMSYFRVKYILEYVKMNPESADFQLSDEEISVLLSEYKNNELWEKYIPDGSWKTEGFLVIQISELSREVEIDHLKEKLIAPSESQNISAIIQDIRSIFENPNLQVGSFIVENENLKSGNLEVFPALTFPNEKTIFRSDYADDAIRQKLFEKNELVLINDVSYYEKQNGVSDFTSYLQSQTIASLVLKPFKISDSLWFLVEIASSEKNFINAFNLMNLEEIAPFLMEYAQRFNREYEKELQLIIEENCTAIQPSIAWKFRNEAERYFKTKINKKDAVFKEITFQNLYPLYGQVDVVGSSEARNKAIEKDIFEMLQLSRQILIRMKSPLANILLEGVESQLNRLKNEFNATTESRIEQWFQKNIAPILSGMTNKVFSSYPNSQYFDRESKRYSHERRKYSQTIDEINRMMGSFLQEKEKVAQQIFPHYFEMFKTDGVAHSIFIGQSIFPPQHFDSEILQKMRMWQLETICEMEELYYQNSPNLPLSLKVASMIFAYEETLSIAYRMDEKHFDVDGAENSRYEILKKRIDKAIVKKTGQRLTQPHQLTIVFSSKHLLKEYQRYLTILNEKGFVKGTVKILEIGDLQGAKGLLALQVALNLKK